jgi:hypothetical protein
MPRRALLVPAALAAILAAASLPAGAWTDGTRARMLRDALKVTSPDLDAVLTHYHKDLERGMFELTSHEDEEVHYQVADGGPGLAAAAAAKVAAEAAPLVLEKHGLRRFTHEMGLLAHLVADINFPLNASDADPREPLYREAYRRYVESMLERIPYVLDRAPAPALERDGVEPYLMAGAARDYGSIGPAFKDDGTPRSPAAVDERSIPFGAASLAYSQAVNDIVLLWERVWREADSLPAKKSPSTARKK